MSSNAVLSSPRMKSDPKRKASGSSVTSTSGKNRDDSRVRSLWTFPSYAAAAVSLLLVVAVFDYVLAFFVATRLVPVLMASVATGLSIDVASATKAGLAVWLGASVTLIAFLCVLSIVLMRAAWRARAALMKKLARRLQAA